MYFISRWQHTQQNTGGHFILDCIRHRSNGYSRHPVLQNDEKGTVRFRQGYHLLKTSATKRATSQSISSFISTIFSSIFLLQRCVFTVVWYYSYWDVGVIVIYTWSAIFRKYLRCFLFMNLLYSCVRILADISKVAYWSLSNYMRIVMKFFETLQQPDLILRNIYGF